MPKQTNIPNNLNFGQKHKLIVFHPIIFLLFFVVGSFLLANTALLSGINAEKIIELTNLERKKENLGELTINEQLAAAARNKALSILNTQKFQHNIDDAKFSAWIKDAGYRYDYVGENLAIDFISSEGVIRAWLDSDTHKKNLLNTRFTEIGVAVVDGNFNGNNSTVVVQIFGLPKTYALAKDNNYGQNSLPNIANNEGELLLTNSSPSKNSVNGYHQEFIGNIKFYASLYTKNNFLFFMMIIILSILYLYAVGQYEYQDQSG